MLVSESSYKQLPLITSVITQYSNWCYEQQFLYDDIVKRRDDILQLIQHC
jgi:hypothetical protein